MVRIGKKTTLFRVYIERLSGRKPTDETKRLRVHDIKDLEFLRT